MIDTVHAAMHRFIFFVTRFIGSNWQLLTSFGVKLANRLRDCEALRIGTLCLLQRCQSFLEPGFGKISDTRGFAIPVEAKQYQSIGQSNWCSQRHQYTDDQPMTSQPNTLKSGKVVIFEDIERQAAAR